MRDTREHPSRLITPPGGEARVVGKPELVVWATAALVFVVTLVSFLPALDGQFVNWDDDRNFVDNPHYRGLGLPQLRWMFFTFHLGHYIPVTWLTLGFDYLVWGMDARGYHLSSLLFHAATTTLFFFLSLRLLTVALGEPRGARPVVGAGVAALLFGIHPLRVESVAWITERRDVVSGLFYVTAIIAYLRAVAGGRGFRSGWYWASLGSFAFALLSKSITTTLPLTLLVLDVYPLRRLGGAAGWRRPSVWLEKLPFLALSVLASVIAFAGLRTLGNLVSLDSAGLFLRLAIAVYGSALYLTKTLAPVRLSPLYELPIVVAWWHGTLVASVAILAVVTRRRWPAFGAAVAAFGIALLPVVGLLQNGPQMAADRYSYLSCMSWAALAGGLVGRAGTAALPRRALAAATIAVLATLTWQQSGVWKNSVTLWRQAVTVVPDGRAAHFNLARALEAEGRIEQAAAEYYETQRLSTNEGFWYVYIAKVFERHGNDSEALRLFRQALAVPSQVAEACAGIARISTRSAGAAADSQCR
jgi:tetratricopeptide (TPR) repeat protein